jgi:hypothetical protein
MDQEKLAAAQEELMRHQWDTFSTQPLTIAQGGTGVIVPGCVHCRKILYTVNQYLSHLAIDVLPGIMERALCQTSET